MLSTEKDEATEAFIKNLYIPDYRIWTTESYESSLAKDKGMDWTFDDAA